MNAAYDEFNEASAVAQWPNVAGLGGMIMVAEDAVAKATGLADRSESQAHLDQITTLYKIAEANQARLEEARRGVEDARPA